MVFVNKSDSDIFFERVDPVSQTPRPESSNYGQNKPASSSKFRSTKRLSIAPPSLSQTRGRNPLLSETMPDYQNSGSVSRRKFVEYKPSQTLTNLNMKRYLMPSEMISLDELRKFKKSENIQNRQKSTIFDNATTKSNNNPNAGLPPRSPAKGKIRL